MEPRLDEGSFAFAAPFDKGKGAERGRRRSEYWTLRRDGEAGEAGGAGEEGRSGELVRVVARLLREGVEGVELDCGLSDSTDCIVVGDDGAAIKPELKSSSATRRLLTARSGIEVLWRELREPYVRGIAPSLY